MVEPAAGLSLRALTRSGLVLAGLLLLGVGLGDAVAGRTKIAQYEELLRTTATRPPADPTALFPTASEAQERYDIVHAKLAFYHLLLTAGQGLSGLGFLLLGAGALRVRMLALRVARESSLSN